MPSAAPPLGAGRASTSSSLSSATVPAAAGGGAGASASSSSTAQGNGTNGAIVNGVGADESSHPATADARTNADAAATTITAASSPANHASATAGRSHAPPSITSSTSSSKPSLLSRLGMPSLSLRSRNRNVVDFHVRADEPYKKYAPGDVVRGSVLLAIVKPVRITHLVVALHGYVHVYRDASAAAKAQSSNIQPRSGTSELPQYHGSGLASLFQDEQVLSGEGRLEAGRYEFGFELLFPDIGLPSSIEFERGTISYMITATLTRPTAIAPTTSCDTRIMLSEHIDVGHLPNPRPRTIFLEPISKRARRKRSTGLDKATIGSAETATASTLNTVTTPSYTNDITSEPELVERSLTATETVRDNHDHGQNHNHNHNHNHADHRAGTHMDTRSQVSGESGRSGRSGRSANTGTSRSDFALSQAGSAHKSPAKQEVVDNNTITATILLQKGGCLAGDTITVRVAVQHIKRLKSMTGIIVTLYRQSKMDSAPSATLFTGNDIEDGNEPDTKSRLGLGGLSLSSTGSASMFRKDLDQNTAPLIVDPHTLRTSVNLSLRLPDDAFPTIRGVPGGMISFRYHVEVIVDLGGKLSSQLLQGGQTTNSRAGQNGIAASELSSSSHAPRTASQIIETSPLRRQKGVVSVSMEIIVGTTDSSRGKRALRISPPQATPRVAEDDEDDAIRPEQNDRTPVATSPQMYLSPPSSERLYGAPTSHPHYQHQSVPGPSQPEHARPNGYMPEAAPAYIPSPQLPDQNALSEKERIRQAETRLLPSQPTTAASAAGPSTVPEEDDLYESQDTPRPPYATPSAPGASADADEDTAAPGPSAPTEADLAAPPLHGAPPTEDKQELERRRLIDEASAPPDFPDDMERSNDASPSVNGEGSSSAEPSAPVLDEDEETLTRYGGGSGGGGGAGPSSSRRSRDEHTEQLPAYER